MRNGLDNISSVTKLKFVTLYRYVKDIVKVISKLSTLNLLRNHHVVLFDVNSGHIAGITEAILDFTEIQKVKNENLTNK